MPCGFGAKEAGELDVARADAQQAGIFTGAAALHGGADHHAGKGKLDAVIDGREEHRLRAAAARAGDRGALGIDLGQGEQEVESAHGVEVCRPMMDCRCASACGL
jgi:hypothetical protein